MQNFTGVYMELYELIDTSHLNAPDFLSEKKSMCYLTDLNVKILRVETCHLSICYRHPLIVILLTNHLTDRHRWEQYLIGRGTKANKLDWCFSNCLGGLSHTDKHGQFLTKQIKINCINKQNKEKMSLRQQDRCSIKWNVHISSWGDVDVLSSSLSYLVCESITHSVSPCLVTTTGSIKI